MKYVMYLAVFAICFVVACYMVPEYPEIADSATEYVHETRLNSAGDRLLVRTNQYDYDFILPTKSLSLALAPLQHSNPIKSSDTPWYPLADLSRLQINTDGSFGSRLTVSFTGLDSQFRFTNVQIPDEEIARLEKFGFTRIKRQFAGNLNATWSTDVIGHRHALDSLNDYSGPELSTCCGSMVTVILDAPETIEHNRQLNTRLRPVTVVTDAVKDAVSVCFLLVFVLFGGHLGLPTG